MAEPAVTEERPQARRTAYAQDTRLLAIDTPLGKDKLLLTRFGGEEEVSRPFSFHATMLSADQNIMPESLIGNAVTVWIRNYQTGRVPISGMVKSLSAGSVDATGLRDYHAEIVPWLWFLSCTTNSRIFQNLTVPKIIQTIFAEFGFSDYDMSLIGRHEPLDFCVQYRETALDFISRWMEELGIFYFFRHEADRHVMVLADHNAAFKPVVEKNAVFGSASSGEVTSWRHSYEFRPGRYAHKDFAFKTPSQDLQTREKSLLKLVGADGLEIYDYPGGYTQKDAGQALSRLRMEEIEARYHTVAGTSSCASFYAGGRFTVARHPVKAEENKEYVLLRVRHEASDNSHLSLNAAPPSYGNSFEAFPAGVRFRPASRTPWPSVQGPQTASVVGPAGETIHTDKYGRVKLQFHWDRRGKSDDKSSCWVRVSQNWAGKNWGGVFIPHVGHEVVVSFLEGDPDIPMVTGRVYNAENMQAITLPANKTQSSIQDHAGNLITMEGKSGVQDIRIHAVKDMHETVDHDHDSTIFNDETTTIEGNRTETVFKNETISIGGNRTENVSKNESVTIDVARTHSIGTIDTLIVGAARFHTVGAAETISVGAARSVTVGAVQTVEVGASQSISVGRSQTISVGADESLTVGGNETVSVAKDRSTSIGQNESLDVGKTISISAGDEIVLKTGSATITMKKNGDITIEGKTITIKGSGDVIIKGQKILQN